MKEAINIGALAAKVIHLDDRKVNVKPTPVKKAENQAPSKKFVKHYAVVPWRAVADNRINKTAALPVLMAICGYTNRHGETWVGQDTLAAIFGVTRQAVQKQIHRLIELGYMERLIRGNKNYSSRYRVIFDTSLTKEDVHANIPARLQDDQQMRVSGGEPLPKEVARDRLKAARQAMSKQPLRLSDDEDITQPPEVVSTSISTQPQRLPNTGSQCNLESSQCNQKGVSRQPPEVARISEGKHKEGIHEYFLKKKKENGFAYACSCAHECTCADDHARASESACALMSAWGIPDHLVRELIDDQIRVSLLRNIEPKADLGYLADLGEDGLWDLISRLPS